MKTFGNYQPNTINVRSARRNITRAAGLIVLLVLGGFFLVNYPVETTVLMLLAASLLVMGRE